MAASRRCTRLFAVLLVLLILSVLTAPFVQGNEKKPAASKKHLRELMTERHKTLQEVATSLERSFQNGLNDLPAWRRVTIAMYHAEADLCSTDAERIKVYEKQVNALQNQQDRAAALDAAGLILSWQLQEAKAATLQAQIELERARLAQ